MQIFDHLIFIFYIFLIVFSTVGHGYIFSRLFYKDFLRLSIGFHGLIGFFSMSLYSIISSIFLAHNYLHNVILHLVGIIFLIFFLKKDIVSFNDIKKLFLFTFVLFIGSYVFKNHDDFPYYHLTYALNISQNSLIIGTGIFSHGFRTFSSLFYYHSILYLPYIKFYLFHIGPFLIIIYFNLIIYSKLINNYNLPKKKFINYFAILSLLFVNIVFYRIGEHGTDRSSQVLLLLVFILFFELIYLDFKKLEFTNKINLFLLLILLAASMKALYYIYFLLLPAILIKKKYFKDYFVSKNFFIICVFCFSFSFSLLFNFLSTGCFLYPAKSTCVENVKWSIPIKQVEKMQNHYEWWAKSGGGPGYQSDIPKEEYIQKFNWVSNWIEKHFFNKVSDSLLGILLMSIIFLLAILLWSFKKKNSIIIRYYAFVFPIIFLMEWFINHPAMRYGGYVLFAIPIFVFTSNFLERYIIDFKILKKIFTYFIITSIIIFNIRNIIRIDKEVKVYNFNLLKSPFFLVKDVNVDKIFDDGKFKVYSTKENVMCWASPTPCSYHKKIKTDKLLGINMVLKD